jgi:hypothetical protein
VYPYIQSPPPAAPMPPECMRRHSATAPHPSEHVHGSSPMCARAPGGAMPVRAWGGGRAHPSCVLSQTRVYQN